MGVVMERWCPTQQMLGVFPMKKALTISFALSLVLCQAPVRQANATDDWEFDFRICHVSKTFSFDGDHTLGHTLSMNVVTAVDRAIVNLELKDVLALQKFIPDLKKCEAFYQCVTERDGYVKPKGKRPKHCYENDRRWR
jgi:hypothetical protein